GAVGRRRGRRRRGAACAGAALTAGGAGARGTAGRGRGLRDHPKTPRGPRGPSRAFTADPHRYLQVSTSDIGDGSHPRSGPLDPPRSSRMSSDPAAAVRERLVELAGALRRGGVRVGTGEVEAAAHALAAVDAASRTDSRLALR